MNDTSGSSASDLGLDFLSDGGQTGALMRSHDWSTSPLGPPQTWPQSLRSVVGLLLASRFPMFVAWGEELGFLYNDPYAEILGAKHPRALGIRFHDIWSEIWPDISPLIDAALAGRATYREDLPLVMNRKGYDEHTWFTFSYSPVRDESGKVAGMFCAVHETTEKVVAERALLDVNDTLEQRVADAVAERNVLADIVERTDSCVQVADFDYRWLAVNNAAVLEYERIYGVRPRVGDSMLDLLADRPEHQAAVKAAWSRALAGEEFTAIGEFGDPALERRAYETKFNTLRDRDGAPTGAYAFSHDVTQRLRDQKRLREAEDALRQAQKLESIGMLTGGVAHDFNNLLAVISNGLQVLEVQKDHDRRGYIIEAMRRAVRRGTDLTRHLLAFSRRKPVHPETIDLAAQLNGMRELLSRSLRGDVEVHMTFDPALWPVEVDPGELELAVLNICVNGRDAMPSGGVLTIAAENARDGAAGDVRGDFVRLSIEDTGTGMPPEVLAHVFEPFFTTKDLGKGSGLGLAQVYGFAHQSGGRVTIESGVGKGTRVALLLPRSYSIPVAAEDAKTGVRADAAGDIVLRGHVLLVEDDTEVAAPTSEVLCGMGLRVTHVTGAHAALGALVDGAAIDLVFSDVMMPGGMNGVELAREIKRRRPDLPIVLTTGFESAAEGVENDFAGLLLKPYRVEALVEVLKTHLDHRAAALSSAGDAPRA